MLENLLIAILMAFGIFCGVISLITFVRNEQVYKYVNKRNHQIYSMGVWEIWNVPDTTKHKYDKFCDIYDSVSYNTMVIYFWKPLDSFFPDHWTQELNKWPGD